MDQTPNENLAEGAVLRSLSNTAIILSIGDELTLGQTVDTNSAWLSQRLAAVGCRVKRHITVGDDQADTEEAIREAIGNCDFLISTGGIGPTEDDLTRQAIAAVMGEPLEMNDAWLARLEAFFRKVNRPMSPLNRIQAMIPRGGEMIENTAGTAAGVRATLHAPGGRPMTVFAMPGVPREMKIMFERDVLPVVKTAGGGAVILSRTLHTFGLGESNVADLLKSSGDLMHRGRNPSVGTTVANAIVSLRVNAQFASADDAQRELAATVAECRSALGDLIWGADDEVLPAVIGYMLTSAGKTVTTAESCTGGLVAKYLTDIPGSSSYYRRGWVTYSNAAKESMLGVPAEMLQEYGAVSEPVVAAMADGARERAVSDFALSISGIAGPDGGTPSKPVGTVCFGLSTAAGTTTRTFVLVGDREMIRDRSAKMALTMLRFALMGKPLPF